MNGNSTLERRYSFNMAQINPAAESTHLNGSGFSWGTSMSPKHRSNSSLCLNNTHIADDGNNRSIVVSPKSKNISKIDARIVADVQSKGLASRIVKYHESGTRLNRSMSAHNLYTKPGQFPAVTLKKTELPYRATKQELSMIRIPPPEKSSFYGNTISSLLRSSSVVGLQSKRSEDLSRENRPIIHPPPTEDDMAPTRSVLDVLKEISRKRINSDDLESDETSKKYCNRAGIDFVDTGNNCTSGFTAASLCSQRYKRQRDSITPHQSVQIAETKTSPEQAKKRVCNYNNDITSSLSSSIKCKPKGSVKRISHNLNQTMPTNLESYEIQKAKMQRHHLDYHDNDKNNTRIDVRFENFENNLRKMDSIKPITPIPATPGTQDQRYNGGVPPMRTVSEPIYNSQQKLAMNSQQMANKPRLTLFNKKCDDNESVESKELCENGGDSNDFNDVDDCAGIPFVKPKKITSISGLRNPVIERTQKSKLALMLSGLRGELYQNSEFDDVDSFKEIPKKPEVINTVTNEVTSTLKSTTALTNVTSSSKEVPLSAPTSLNLSTNTTTTTTSTASLNASSVKTSSPLVGLKLSQPSTENVTSTLGISAPKSSDTLPKTNTPLMGGFTFGTKTSLPVANTKTENNGLKDTKISLATPSSSTTTNNVINFSSSTQLTSNTSDDANKLKTNLQPSGQDNSLKLPSVGTAFTLLSNSTSVPATNITSTLKTTNTFSFGKTETTSAISTIIPSAGQTATNSLNKPNNAFNFAAPASSSAAPVFGSLTSSTAPTSNVSSATSTTTSSTLTFGAIDPPKSSTENNSLLTFNAPKATTAAPTTISTNLGGNPSASFTFGSNTSTPSLPTFGTNTDSGIKTQQTSSTFSFNSENNNQALPVIDQNKSSSSSVPQSETNLFSFGSPSVKASATSTGAPASIFSNNSNSLTNATPLFGSNSIKTNAPTFGSSSENKTAAMATTSVFGAGTNNSGTPTFGSNVEGKQPTMATASVFGAGSSNNSIPTFGSTAENKSATSVFGAGNSNSSTPTFGSTAENKLATMGTASVFGASNSNASTPTFGSTAENKSATISVFGAGSSNSNTSTPFSFGSKPAISNTVNANNGNASSGGFSFGSVASNTTSSTPFGFGNNTGGTTNSSTNTFGATSSTSVPNKSFTFGAAASKSDNPTNVFGGPVNKPAENTASSGGFSFGSAMSAPKTGTFSFGAGGNSFSGSNVSNTNNQSSGFSFGGATATKTNEASANKAFSFGSTQPQQLQQQPQQQLGVNNNVNSTNIFGSSATTKPVQPQAFSFNSGNPTSMPTNPPTPNNIFAPPSTNMAPGPGDRIIRRATRRLQK